MSDIRNEQLQWIKSSRSSGGGQCVELAKLPNGGVGLRDSKNPDGPRLEFTEGEMRAFVDGATDGDFNGLLG